MTRYRIVKGKFGYHIQKEVEYVFLFWGWTAWEPLKEPASSGKGLQTKWFNTFNATDKFVKHLYRQERKRLRKV